MNVCGDECRGDESRTIGAILALIVIGYWVVESWLNSCSIICQKLSVFDNWFIWSDWLALWHSSCTPAMCNFNGNGICYERGSPRFSNLNILESQHWSSSIEKVMFSLDKSWLIIWFWHPIRTRSYSTHVWWLYAFTAHFSTSVWLQVHSSADWTNCNRVYRFSGISMKEKRGRKFVQFLVQSMVISGTMGFAMGKAISGRDDCSANSAVI